MKTLRPERIWTRENLRLILVLLLTAVGYNLFIEILSRRSFYDALNFILSSPAVFLYGALLIYLTLSVSLLFRRRIFWFMLFSAIWLGLAVTNFILLTFRSMPLTASDIWLLSSVRDIFEKYLSHVQLALLMLGIAAALSLIFYLWSRAKQFSRKLVFAAINGLLTAVLVVATTLLLQSIQLLDRPTAFSNLPRAYHNNGFVYSFSTSLLTGGISQPEKYSPNEVEAIIQDQKELPQTSEKTPNIIFVQLESFFDPKYMKDLRYAEDPIPNFTSLKETCPSGLLSVPCVGAGTANTEFEVLTGMNLDHFGVGEYPYMTIASQRPADSLAFSLEKIGYQTHAIHNNNATFYDRHIVYQNLGFETFTALEYMDDVVYNPRGWAKDAVLTDEVLKALRSTPEKDFVFTVSVQPHGKYPTEPLPDAPTITVEGLENDPARENGFSYYLYQLKECDAFVGELIHALSEFDEPTVVAFYGDHLPSFHIQNTELSHGDTQTTEYVIWSNYGIEKVDRDLQTYQLGAYVFNFCRIHEGAVFRLHQTYDYALENNEEYQSALQVLEYDMIDGEHYYLDMPSPAQMRFDVEDVSVTDVLPEAAEEKSFLVKGAHFTPFTVVYLNDEPCETEYLSQSLLRVNGTLPEGEGKLFAAQVSASDSLTVLSQSETYLYEGEITDE